MGVVIVPVRSVVTVTGRVVCGFCGVSHKYRWLLRVNPHRLGGAVKYYLAAGKAFSSASVHCVVRSANSLRIDETYSGVMASLMSLPKLVRT